MFLILWLAGVVSLSGLAVSACTAIVPAVATDAACPTESVFEAHGRIGVLAADEAQEHAANLSQAWGQIHVLAVESEQCAANLSEAWGRVDVLVVESGECAANLSKAWGRIGVLAVEREECTASLSEAQGKVDALTAQKADLRSKLEAKELVCLKQEEAAGQESWSIQLAAASAEGMPLRAFELACLAMLLCLGVLVGLGWREIRGLKSRQACVVDLATLHARHSGGEAPASSTDDSSTLAGFQMVFSRDDEGRQGATGEPQCFTPNSVIRAADGGLLRAPDLQPGVRVALTDGHEAHVVRVDEFPWRRTEPYKLIVLRTAQGQFEVSANHRVVVPLAGGRRGESRADMLRVGDSVIVGQREQCIVGVKKKEARTWLYSVVFEPDGEVETFNWPRHGIVTHGAPPEGEEAHMLRMAGLPEATQAELAGVRHADGFYEE